VVRHNDCWHSPIDSCSHSGGNYVLGYLRRHQSIGRVAKGLYSLFSICRCTFARQGEVLPFRRSPVYKLPSALYIRKLVRLNSAIQRQRMFGRRCAHPSSLHCHYRNFRLLGGLRRQSHIPSDSFDISWSVIYSLEVDIVAYGRG
jgi:hypothetical protein